MAGTGHSWDVVNAASAKAFLASFGKALTPACERWFTTPHVIKYATGELFVVKLSGSAAEKAIRRHAAADEVEILLRRSAEGADLRLFKEDYFRELGPDLGHVADWLWSLPSRDPRMVGKLSKVTVDAAIRLADRWSIARVKKLSRNLPAGEMRLVVDGTDGRRWVELLDADALATEALMMDHCVDGYSDRLVSGTRIYSLRDPDGGALVTVETVTTGGRTLVGQVQGRWNRVPSRVVRPDIIALMTALEPHAVSQHVARCGVLRDERGAWRTLEELSERVVFHGYDALGHMGTLHVLDPADPEVTLASIHGPDLKWWSNPSAGGLRMVVDAGQAAPWPTQRAVADLANDLGLGPSHVAYTPVRPIEGLTFEDGLWKSFPDSCERWTVGGVECLVKDDRVHVPTGATTERVGLVVETVPKAHRWTLPTLKAVEHSIDRQVSDETLRRYAAVLDALGVEEDSTKALGGKGVEKLASGEWVFVDGLARRRPFLEPMPEDAERPVWLVTDWLAVLRTSDRRTLTRIAWKDGIISEAKFTETEKGHEADTKRLPDTGARMRSTAKLLDDLGIELSDKSMPPTLNRWTNTSLGADMKFIYRDALVRVGGRWRHFHAPDEVLPALRGLGRSQFNDCGANAAAFLVLPGDDLDDRVLVAKHLARFAATSAKNGSLGIRAIIDRGLIDRLMNALPLLEGRFRKAAVTALATELRTRMGKKRRAGLFDERLAIDLFRKIWREIDTRLLTRVARWALSHDILHDRHDHAAFDVLWFEIFDSPATPSDARWLIEASMRRSLFGIAWRVGEGEVKVSASAALSYVMCLERCFGGSPMRGYDLEKADEARRAVASHAHRHAFDGDAAWSEVAARAAALPGNSLSKAA